MNFKKSQNLTKHTEINIKQLLFREKPKVIKAAEKKTARSDGEPEAKRRKVDVNETTVVQEV